MDTAIKVLGLLPWTDWVAVAAFFVGWVGYAVFAKRRSTLQPSLLDTTNRIRRQWMLQSTYREVRVVDGIVIQNLSTSRANWCARSRSRRAPRCWCST
jgi:uncharacterized membrane protein